MEPELPTWLDKTFLETVLQEGENNEDCVKVIKFSTTKAVEDGNNYMSVPYRVRVHCKVGDSGEELISLIIKAPITKGIVSEMTENTNIYAKEPKVYAELIPKMKEKVNYDFAPKSYYCSSKNILVLKDMNEEGYIMLDKHNQLDFSHCKCVFITLAKFHACSVAYYNENPELIKSVSEELQYFENRPFEKESNDWLTSGVEMTGNILNEIEDCKSYTDFLLSRAEKIGESVTKICKPKEKGLNVLNHGDLWINNMLFKHNDSGEVIDVKLIDFQICRFASPVLDLIYFIWSSANENVRESKLQDLFNIYLETLNNTLEQLGCKERLTKHEMQEDLKSATDLAVITVCNLIPFIMCEKENIVKAEDMSMDDFQNNKHYEKFLKVYNDKRFKDLLPNLLKQVLALHSI